MSASDASCHKFWSKTAIIHSSKEAGPLEESTIHPPLGARFFLKHKLVLGELAVYFSCACLTQSTHQHPPCTVTHDLDPMVATGDEDLTDTVL
jgi:hypothetical protein